MLASFRFPVCDTRFLFQGALGRVVHQHLSGNRELAGVRPSSQLFIRSVGLPRRRLLGPGNDLLDESYFFSLDNVVEISRGPPTQGLFLDIDLARIKRRYYQFDEVCGRLDISIPIRPARYKLKGLIDAIISTLRGLEVSIRRPYMARHSTLSRTGQPFAEFFQSRTSAERLLKFGNPVRAVFGSAPILLLKRFTESLLTEKICSSLEFAAR
jgi:hypothetical protein